MIKPAVQVLLVAARPCFFLRRVVSVDIHLPPDNRIIKKKVSLHLNNVTQEHRPNDTSGRCPRPSLRGYNHRKSRAKAATQQTNPRGNGGGGSALPRTGMACSTYRRKINTHDPSEGAVAEDARRVLASIQPPRKARGGGGGSLGCSYYL